MAVLLVLVAACGGTQATLSPSAPSEAPASASPEPSVAPTGAAGSLGPAGSLASPGGGAFDPGALGLYLEPEVDRLCRRSQSPMPAMAAAASSWSSSAVRSGSCATGSSGDPFLNIGDRLMAGGERGLLGLAFHPNFPEDPRFFVNYTDLEGHTVVSSFTAETGADRADGDSEVVLLRIDQPYPNHNGGALAFGPDGYLYITTGDGGSGGDPHDNGQRMDTLLGKILRIDVDGGSGDARYAVPPDNPFVDQADALPEIWHLGLRNPWRMSFDRETGDLWIGDVGQGSWEEVDVARAGTGGLNFGWNRVEGFECFEGDSCDDPAYTPPVTAYSHDFGCSVTGGVVYRGTAHPLLEGGYVYSDFCGGNLWVLDPTNDGPLDGRLVAETGRDISAIGEDEAGEAYATDLSSGELLRIVATGN